jgi:hypothetical protein
MEKYFVPVEIAVKLKEAGFNEPCLMFFDLEVFGQVVDPHQYRVMGYHSVMNSEIDTERYTAAPLYHQVFDWLEKRDIRIQDYHIFCEEKKWGANVFEMSTGNMLWGPLFSLKKEKEERILYFTKEEAWNEAIKEALKMIK